MAPILQPLLADVLSMLCVFNHTQTQVWDFGSGRLISNFPFYQDPSGSCLLYSACFGKAGPFRGFAMAGGGPLARVYSQVSVGDGLVWYHTSNWHTI